MLSVHYEQMINIVSFPATSPPLASPPLPLLERVEIARRDATQRLDTTQRVALGQFLTPSPVARLMASLFTLSQPHMRLLDAGAGIGTLTAATIEALIHRPAPPVTLDVVAYELDAMLADYLAVTLAGCQVAAQEAGIACQSEIRREDFIAAGTAQARGDFFALPFTPFTTAILNPPYRKIASTSAERALLRSIGAETGNLYTAFLAIAVKLLAPGGELVAITPRSFTNGPYFKPFRTWFLSEMRITRIHIFASRDQAFRDDDVLQENIILHAVKGSEQTGPVTISASRDADDVGTTRTIASHELVHPDDPDAFIHIVPDMREQGVTTRMRALTTSLADLGLTVSTGRVVDFRARDHLRAEPGPDTVPLIYPTHFAGATIQWPKAGGRKPNALVANAETDTLLVPPGIYVLVKRFSAKEEPRRVVAAVYDAERVSPLRVGFENHLNYYHRGGKGLPLLLARGLTAFLNSTIVDTYFRQFNGHTQVNATDLRSFHYPTRTQLEALGAAVGETVQAQDALDALVAREVFGDA